MESDVITLQDIFTFEVEAVSPDRTVIGKLAPTGIHPMFLDKFRKRGVELPSHLFGNARPQVGADLHARANGGRAGRPA
jgi:pilus assembly protein CpaF